MTDERNDVEVDDFEEVEPTTRQENSTLRAIRKAEQEWKQRAKKAEQELRLVKDELSEQVMVNKRTEVIQTFTQAGLPADLADDAWALGHRDAESAAAWAVQRGFLVDKSAEPAPRPDPVSFVPVTGTAGIGQGGPKMSKAEFTKLYANEETRPQAEAAYNAGRVEGMDPNGQPDTW